MPRRTDIHKVMIIGSGPIVIGQACEFDYSGTQACKALRGLGYEVVLVNSNPATIMTDPGMADITYIEPLNLKAMIEIIEKERPDALLPTLGGQSGLNLCSELARCGALEKYGVKVIGVQVDAIERGEDRIAFKDTMNRLGIDMPESAPAYSVEEAEAIAARLGYPVVIRPAYTMGGTGGGLVYNVEELRTVASRGIAASLGGQILVEESVLGWEELELEVVRDAKNQMITVCFIENVDAMGVHTGDSYCTAPMLTISPELQADLQEKSYRIVEAIQVIGGTNIQFAHNPKTGRVVVIEINPRTSRSSALASKATGFPIAQVSSKLAAGLTLDEIPYWRRGTLEKYEPWGDYVVVKFARWAFEKFRGSEDRLGTQMRAVGEAMSIGKTYKEAFQKAIRSLETGRYGLGFARDYHTKTLEELLTLLNQPSSERQFQMYEAIRKGATTEQLYEKTHIKPYFIEQMRELVQLEEEILAYRGRPLPDELLARAKRDGFADRYLANLLGVKEAEIRAQRKRLGVVEGWAAVPVSGVENAAYYYSTYNAPDETTASPNSKKVMVLGGGPNRIGQGIEFDYCCVHAAFALRDAGYESIMVNCNPETVSTDYDTSNKLYFEPLTVEDVLSIYEKEKPAGVIVQFGGQTPLNIAGELAASGVKILGTSVETIDLAEDRDRFRKMMARLGFPCPSPTWR
jgi:carbamoyl-phosphate synthase large subunit